MIRLSNKIILEQELLVYDSYHYNTEKMKILMALGIVNEIEIKKDYVVI